MRLEQRTPITDAAGIADREGVFRVLVKSTSCWGKVNPLTIIGEGWGGGLHHSLRRYVAGVA